MTEIKPWTAEEDKYCVRTFFCNGIGSFPDFNDFKSENHTIDQIQDRFLTILNEKVLLERVRQKFHGDIFQISKEQFPFSLIENYNYVNAMRILQTQLAKPVMKYFQDRFHISRTKGQFESEKFLLLTKGQLGYDKQLQNFLEFKKAMIEKYKGSPLTLDLNVSQVAPYFFEKSPQFSILPEVGDTIDEIDKSVQNSFVQGDLAALKGKAANILTIRKPLVFIGRTSQFIDVDIDLTFYHTLNVSRRHASIKLCTDLHFYIECLGSNLIVNGKVLLKGEKALLGHRDIIDIGGCLLIFFERVEFMNKIRTMQGEKI